VLLPLSSRILPAIGAKQRPRTDSAPAGCESRRAAAASLRQRPHGIAGGGGAGISALLATPKKSWWKTLERCLIAAGPICSCLRTSTSPWRRLLVRRNRSLRWGSGFPSQRSSTLAQAEQGGPGRVRRGRRAPAVGPGPRTPRSDPAAEVRSPSLFLGDATNLGVHPARLPRAGQQRCQQARSSCSAPTFQSRCLRL